MHLVYVGATRVAVLPLSCDAEVWFNLLSQAFTFNKYIMEILKLLCYYMLPPQ